MKEHLSRQVARQLLQNARLQDFEVRALLEKALDRDYWVRLNPGLALNDLGGMELLDADLARIGRAFAVEGYFTTSPILQAALIGWMRECVELLRRERWPPVFGFVYDEFWMIARMEPVKR